LKFLVTGKEIQKELIRLIESSEAFDWSVAWASHASECHKYLVKYRSKIRKIVIGTHFYQTHPQFLKEFCDSENVRIIQQPSGVFHPKAYYFEFKDGSWECIVGSANFTKSAFDVNEEIAILIKSSDLDAAVEIEKLTSKINSLWDFASVISEEFVRKYEALWKIKSRYLKKLAGDFGTAKHSKKDKFKDTFLESDISTFEWDDYFARVVADDEHNLEGRIIVLESIKEYFSKYGQFQAMPQLLRKRIAGLVSDEGIEWKWFGSMIGSGRFKNRVNENDEFLSLALDCIPLTGAVHQENYKDFISLYMKAFGGEGNYLGTATRLLAMKRPDYFICLDSANKDNFCKDFSIPKTQTNLDNYWDEVVERIKECVWWNSLPPDDPVQKSVWSARAAFLDALYYVPK
jgi:HKD family nuclease